MSESGFARGLSTGYDENMKITFTIEDLKADLPGVLKHVCDGKVANIALGDEIIAEIRPVEPRKYTMEQRLEELRHRGLLKGSGEPRRPFKPGKPSPGALARFLAEREAAYLE